MRGGNVKGVNAGQGMGGKVCAAKASFSCLVYFDNNLRGGSVGSESLWGVRILSSSSDEWKDLRHHSLAEWMNFNRKALAMNKNCRIWTIVGPAFRQRLSAARPDRQFDESSGERLNLLAMRQNTDAARG